LFNVAVRDSRGEAGKERVERKILRKFTETQEDEMRKKNFRGNGKEKFERGYNGERIDLVELNTAGGHSRNCSSGSLH